MSEIVLRTEREEGRYMTEETKERLWLWRERFEKAAAAYADDVAGIERRNAVYAGTTTVYDSNGSPTKEKAVYGRNLTFELIETQIDTSIPAPKVIAPTDDPKKQTRARMLEAFLNAWRKVVDLTKINDLDERVAKIHGSTFPVVFWDNNIRTESYCGLPNVRLLHPDDIVPQAGLSDIADMDYIFVKYTDTKTNIEKKYGVTLDEDDTTSEGYGTVGSAAQDNPEETIVQITAYYRNDDGKLGIFSWAADTVLEDVESYYVRQGKVCKKCGKPEYEAKDGECPCGCREFERQKEDFELIEAPVLLSDGSRIEAQTPVFDAEGNPETETVDVGGVPIEKTKTVPTKIKYYVPDLMPVINRKNVSVYGRFLGDNDIDVIYPQQKAYNILLTNIMTRLVKGGSVLTLPKGVKVETSDKEMKVVYLDSAAQASLINAVPLEPSIQQQLAMLDIIYRDAQSTLGVTDSFQGKQDSTATSGTAKQASISQAAGRFSSKRENKKSAYIRIYTAVFQLMLAFADEGMEVRGDDGNGGQKTYHFSRYDFLDIDPVTGEYVYDDDYIIDIDSTAAYTNDRQAMWTEIRNNFASGAYGNPQDPSTLALYWDSLSEQGYPGAKKIADRFMQLGQSQEAAAQEVQLQAAGLEGSAECVPLSGTEEVPQTAGDEEDDAETQALISRAQGLLSE